MNSKSLFRFMVITDRKMCGEKNLTGIIKSCSAAGVKAFQLREKDLTSVELLNLANHLRKVIRQNDSYLLINDRLDIALLAQADGIHVPVSGVEANKLRKFSKQMLLGRSVHSVMQAKEAQKNGFDYILFGPVFRTPAKVKYGKPQGIEKLREICESVSIPVFAVGGINPARARKCIDAGAWGVAAIGAVMKSANVTKTILEFKTSLGAL
jgi:thiamine-phosphate pyrophosphorylase